MNTPSDDYKTVTVVRTFDAPREQVWKMWTDPLLLALWLGPKGFTVPSVKMDVTVGGRYQWCMHGRPGPEQDPRDFWSIGTYKEVVPTERLVYTDSFSDQDGTVVSPEEYGMPEMATERVVTVVFEEKDGKTNVTLSHTGFPNGVPAEGSFIGWNQSFDKLDALLK